MSNKEQTPPINWYKDLKERFPEIMEKYEALGTAVHTLGPLDSRVRALIKIALAGSSRHHRSLVTQVRKGKAAEVSKEEMEQVALLAIPTLGFPKAMSMLRIIDEEYDK